MNPRRLYLGVIGLALLIGVLVAVVSSGTKTPLVRSGPSPTPASGSPTPARPSLAASPSGSTATPTPTFNLGVALRPASVGRTIAGTTVIFGHQSGGGGGSELLSLAVPLSPPPSSTSPAPARADLDARALVAFSQDEGWQVRPDGTSLAVALDVAPDSARVAVWNIRSGTVSWLTPDEPSTRHMTPVWSPDGSLLYYASARGTTDLGIWRVRADGTANALIRRPDSKGTVELQGLTPDGAGLVFSYSRAGGSVDIFDLVTGADRAFDDSTAASITAWRTARPRALVLVGGGAGQPAQTLTSWDDIAGTKKILLGPTVPGSPTGVYGADFDATGTRIAVAVYNKVDGADALSAIHIMDANGGGRTPLAGSDGAMSVLWFRAGLVYTRRNAAGGTDIMLIQPTGGVPVTLYSDPGQLGKLTFVSP